SGTPAKEGKSLNELKVQELRNELERRQLDKNGIKIILSVRLEKALRDEGHDPDTYRFMTVDSASNATAEKTPEPVPVPIVQDEKRNTEGKANGTESKPAEVTSANTTQAAFTENSATKQPPAVTAVGEKIAADPSAETQRPVSETSTENKSEEREGGKIVKEEEAGDVEMKDERATEEKEPEPAEQSVPSATAVPEKKNEKEPESAQVQEEEMLEDPLDEETNEEKSGQNGAADKAATAQANQNQDDDKGSTVNLTPEEINKRSIWIRGISKDTTAASLKILCLKVGKVIRAKIFTARARKDVCYGFVTMADPETAQKCVTELNKTKMPDGNLITVEKADDKKSTSDATGSSDGKTESGKAGDKPGTSSESGNKSGNNSGKPGHSSNRDKQLGNRRERRREAAAARRKDRVQGPSTGGPPPKRPRDERDRRRGGISSGGPMSYRGGPPPSRFAEPRGGAFPKRPGHPTSRGIRGRPIIASGMSRGNDSRVSISTSQLRSRGPPPVSAWDRRHGELEAIRHREEERANRDRELEMLRLAREAEAIRLEREKIEKERLELQLQTALAQQQIAAAAAAAQQGGQSSILVQAQQHQHQHQQGGGPGASRRSRHEDRHHSGRNHSDSRSRDRNSSRDDRRQSGGNAASHRRVETGRGGSSRDDIRTSGRTGTLMDLTRNRRPIEMQPSQARHSMESRIARPDMRPAQDRSSRLSDGRSDRRDATQPRSLASINTSAYTHNQERSYNPSYNPGRDINSVYPSSTSYYAQSRDAFSRGDSGRSAQPISWTDQSLVTNTGAAISNLGYGSSSSNWNTSSSTSHGLSNVNTSTTGWNRAAANEWNSSYGGSGASGSSSSSRYPGYEDKYSSRRY
ncbi:hypothetical protein WR25_14219, partial [Diploscapter pachys]